VVAGRYAPGRAVELTDDNVLPAALEAGFVGRGLVSILVWIAAINARSQVPPYRPSNFMVLKYNSKSPLLSVLLDTCFYRHGMVSNQTSLFAG